METKRKIIEEYKKLVIRNKTANISVADICAEAGIARKTFYNYFKDRFDLLEKIMLEDIENPLRQGIKQDFTFPETIHLVFSSILLEKDFYKIALMEDCQNSLYESLTESFSKIISECYKKPELTEEEAEFVDYKQAMDFVVLISKWAAGGMKQSPEFMRKVVMYPQNDWKR